MTIRLDRNFAMVLACTLISGFFLSSQHVVASSSLIFEELNDNAEGESHQADTNNSFIKKILKESGPTIKPEDNDPFTLWLNYIDNVDSINLLEGSSNTGLDVLPTLSVAQVAADLAAGNWKLERVKVLRHPVTGAEVEANGLFVRFRHKQTGHYLSLRNGVLTLSDPSAGQNPQSAPDIQWRLVPAGLDRARPDPRTIMLTGVDIFHHATGNFIHMQNGVVNVSGHPGTPWSFHSATNAENTGVSANPNPVSPPDMSRIWTSTYGDIYWSEGWYNETNNILTIGAPNWSATQRAYVATGTWGRRDGTQNAGGIEFIYTGPCAFTGSWWYSATPNQKNSWTGQCK